MSKHCGVGLLLRDQQDCLEVEEVVRDGPADWCGKVRPGDLVQAVNRKQVGKRSGFTVSNIKPLIVGPPGTCIILSLKRGAAVFDVELTRAQPGAASRAANSSHSDRKVSGASAASQPKKEEKDNSLEDVRHSVGHYEAVSDYEAQMPHELSLRRGALVEVQRKFRTGWWEGVVQGDDGKKQKGWFPSEMVKTSFKKPTQPGDSSGNASPVNWLAGGTPPPSSASPRRPQSKAASPSPSPEQAPPAAVRQLSEEIEELRTEVEDQDEHVERLTQRCEKLERESKEARKLARSASVLLRELGAVATQLRKAQSKQRQPSKSRPFQSSQNIKGGPKSVSAFQTAGEAEEAVGVKAEVKAEVEEERSNPRGGGGEEEGADAETVEKMRTEITQLRKREGERERRVELLEAARRELEEQVKAAAKAKADAEAARKEAERRVEEIMSDPELFLAGRKAPSQRPPSYSRSNSLPVASVQVPLAAAAAAARAAAGLGAAGLRESVGSAISSTLDSEEDFDPEAPDDDHDRTPASPNTARRRVQA